MDGMIGLAASAASGGVFGLFGTAIGRLAGYFERKQSLAHEKARWVHELALAEQALNQAETAGKWAGLAASLSAEQAIAGSYKWVDAVRALTRPGLTLLLWLITSGIWLGASETDRQAIAETASFAATAATLWWFGDRAPAHQGPNAKQR